jgi:hypothetical protein
MLRHAETPVVGRSMLIVTVPAPVLALVPVLILVLVPMPVPVLTVFCGIACRGATETVSNYLAPRTRPHDRPCDNRTTTMRQTARQTTRQAHDRLCTTGNFDLAHRYYEDLQSIRTFAAMPGHANAHPNAPAGAGAASN